MNIQNTCLTQRLYSGPITTCVSKLCMQISRDINGMAIVGSHQSKLRLLQDNAVSIRPFVCLNLYAFNWMHIHDPIEPVVKCLLTKVLSNYQAVLSTLSVFGIRLVHVCPRPSLWKQNLHALSIVLKTHLCILLLIVLWSVFVTKPHNRWPMRQTSLHLNIGLHNM